jgi:lysine biosynthesis protein LysW
LFEEITVMAKSISKVLIAECPECESHIRFHRTLRLGEIVTCPECSERLEVSDMDPLELDWAFEDDDDDYESWN